MATEPVISPTNPQSSAETAQATEVPNEAPMEVPLLPDPQRIEFTAEDGTKLGGKYFPAAINPYLLVVLMHWAGGDTTDWELIGIIDWLINRRNYKGGGMFSLSKGLYETYIFPEMPEDLPIGVFTFGFSGYGESAISAGDERAGWIMDAKAAYQIAGSLTGVDFTKIAGVGASIGSDGVVDGCGDICLGA